MHKYLIGNFRIQKAVVLIGEVLLELTERHSHEKIQIREDHSNSAHVQVGSTT